MLNPDFDPYEILENTQIQIATLHNNISSQNSLLTALSNNNLKISEYLVQLSKRVERLERTVQALEKKE